MLSAHNELTIRPLADGAEAEACARLMANSDPWLKLGRGYDVQLKFMLNATRERYVACLGETFAGFLVLNMNGALVGYIQAIAVVPELRGGGIGSSMIRFAEDRIFRDHANVFLCVSSFNASARELYERSGYWKVGEFADFFLPGHSEILLRKSRGPIANYRAEKS